MIPASLRNDESFIKEIRKHFQLQVRFGCVDCIEYGPAWLKDERELMVKACKQKGYVYRMLSDRLKLDPDVIQIARASKDGRYWIVCSAPRSLLLENDSLVTEYFIELDEITETRDAKRILPAELWRRKHVVDVYLKAGGIPHELIAPEVWKHGDTCRFCLESASLEKQLSFNPYDWIPKSIMQDRSFALRWATLGLVFGPNARIAKYAPKQVKSDVELVLTTIEYNGMSAVPENMRSQIANQVIQNLAVSACFPLFLKGVCILRPRVHPSKRCLLPRLDIEPIKRLIANYAGVSTGKILGLERRCFSTVLDWKREKDAEIAAIAHSYSYAQDEW